MHVNMGINGYLSIYTFILIILILLCILEDFFTFKSYRKYFINLENEFSMYFSIKVHLFA